MFVGQAPGPGSSGVPFAGSYSGRRLASLMRMSLEDMLQAHDFVNLLNEYPGKGDAHHPRGDAFPMSEARKAAASMNGRLTGRAVILLGRNVSDAFGLREAAWFKWIRCATLDCRVAVVPHPSGVSHWWNSRKNLAEARRFFRSLKRNTTRSSE